MFERTLPMSSSSPLASAPAALSIPLHQSQLPRRGPGERRAAASARPGGRGRIARVADSLAKMKPGESARVRKTFQDPESNRECPRTTGEAILMHSFFALPSRRGLRPPPRTQERLVASDHPRRHTDQRPLPGVQRRRARGLRRRLPRGPPRQGVRRSPRGRPRPRRVPRPVRGLGERPRGIRAQAHAAPRRGVRGGRPVRGVAAEVARPGPDRAGRGGLQPLVPGPEDREGDRGLAREEEA